MSEKDTSFSSKGTGREKPKGTPKGTPKDKGNQQLNVELPPNDHRRIGSDQQLFFFHPMSPGSAFWYPKGAYIYNKLVDFIKEEYRKRGFNEVITPNIYNSQLWEKSGHWQHYADNIFPIEIDNLKFGLKPMNCPGHCLMFGNRMITHKDLPIRYADFGVLHRNEASGALGGLTRVRRFQQDDAHIFCRPDQLVDEIKGCLDFLDHCYVKVFGFSFELVLSTRPETGSLGDAETWNTAESQLKEALNNSGRNWKLNPGDGAFYGPKIDITIKDALKRQHQCATIQLDFQLPQRFDLVYYEADQEKKRPVMIHRAVLGSVERMVAILAESFSGKWPFWLSPRQVAIMTIPKSDTEEYAKEVSDRFFENGFEVEYKEITNESLNRRIRSAQLERFNFILVIGRAEKENGTVNVRTRENDVLGQVNVDVVIRKLRHFRDAKTVNAESSNAWAMA